MKILKKIKIGSQVFFNEMSDYKAKDNDWLVIVDHIIGNNIMINAKINNDDIFMYRNNLSKNDFIEDTFKSNLYMRAGKFLVPEFVKYIGFTIDDLRQLSSIFDKLDDKHKYEKIIYDAYIENNDFILTDKQRNKSYEEYKKYRP